MKLATGFFWVIAVLAILGAVISWSGPQGHAQGEQPKSAPSAENTDANRGVTKEGQPQSQGWRKYKEKIERNEKFITATSTIFIAAFTVLLAFATFFLWMATRDLVKDAQHSGEENSRNMQAAIVEARRSADAAIKAAEVSEQALRMAERPILTIADWHWDNIGPGKSPTFRFMILNTGRTQADIFDHKSYTGYAESIPDEPIYEPGPIHAAVAGGGGRQMIHLEEPQTVITPGRYALMVAGKQFIFIYGRFSYRDAFEDIYDFGFVIKIMAVTKQDGSVVWEGALPDNAGRYIYLKKRKQT